MKARTLFWPCVLGLAVLLAPDSSMADEAPAPKPVIVVPVEDIDELARIHAAMRQRIADLEQKLLKAAGAAQACYAHGGWANKWW